MTKIKICGIKNREDALLCAVAGADAIGLVFAPSLRRVDVEAAEEICAYLPPFISRVGVFVNEPEDTVSRVAERCGLTVLQFHGEEGADYCRRFKLPVLKAVRVRTAADLRGLIHFPAAGFVLDAYDPLLAGGTGTTFDWSLLDKDPGVPVILAGGLTADNVAAAIRTARPYAVDVSSGVEKGGDKDSGLIVSFITAVRRCN